MASTEQAKAIQKCWSIIESNKKMAVIINTQEYDKDELKLSSIITMFQGLKVELKSIFNKYVA